MTLVSSIVRDAYRESNLIALGDEPSQDQRLEGTSRLQNLVSSVFGNEMGDPLRPIPIGRNNIEAPAGYPWYSGTPYADWFVPLNIRLIFNLTESVSLNLHPRPQDGSRLAVQDLSGNLEDFPVTIRGNGNLIEGGETLTLNENGFIGQWLFRADTGQWTRVSALNWNEQFPFPDEFDDLFIASLAMRLNPRYGAETSEETMIALRRSRGQLRARYKQVTAQPSDLALIRLPSNRRNMSDFGGEYSEVAFNSGLAIPSYLL